MIFLGYLEGLLIGGERIDVLIPVEPLVSGQEFAELGLLANSCFFVPHLLFFGWLLRVVELLHLL